jgi:hypothetical protein
MNHLKRNRLSQQESAVSITALSPLHIPSLLPCLLAHCCLNVDQLFGVFQRLQRQEEFKSIGVGLANTWRIIARHGGTVCPQGILDVGAIFGFTLPKPPGGSRGVVRKERLHVLSAGEDCRTLVC